MAIPGNFLSPTTESVDPNTSGWTAKTNCTLALGTGGRNGDGCLQLTSVAAGEMQVRTVASYAVTGLTEYEAFADASGATVPERIGIRWLNVFSSQISISWSPVTTSASSTWHRIAVAAVAPSNAVYAQVVLSCMTPGAGGVIGYFENVYLGLPVRTTGNLLAFDTEQLEAGVGQWTAETNCSIAAQTPPVQWPVDWYLAGGQVLALTVTATGDASAKTVDRPAATPGVQYVGYAYLNPPTSGSSCWVELRFQNAAGSQLSATRSTLAAPGTGYYRQKASAVAPAGTATCTLAVGITSGTAAQVMRVDGAVITTVPVFHDGSVVPYADSSFEQGVAGWTTVSGVAVVSRSTPWGTYGWDGYYAGTITSSTATTSVVRSAKFPLPAGSAGTTWRVETLEQVTAGGFTLTRSVRWYSATNVDLGATSSSAATAPTPGWWQLDNTFTAPANATQAAVEYTLTATSTSSVIRIDQVSLWPDQPSSQVTANDASASVTVTLRDLYSGDYLSLWRVTPDGTRTLVRGTDGLIDAQLLAATELIVVDYEAPLGMDVYYYAETRDSTGALVEFRTTDPVSLAPGSVQYGWLKDPGYPARNIHVMIAKGPDWQRPIEQTAYRVRGRRNAVVHSDVRGGLQGDLVVYTLSDEERADLHWLLDSGSVLLWQAAPGMGVVDMYVNVGQVSETRGGGIASEEIRIWTLPLTQADMPVSVGVAGSAGRTWQDILTEQSTWQDILDKYATWEDVLFNRPKG
ncbi:hypothetical protein AB0M57_04800 [Streptomyces sp. NPDC051597]|uniref:hypothetical protein n=1 Tax=Streptomyces sp. NPDC051597 TaxID=3155049 RepID=UPI003430C823